MNDHFIKNIEIKNFKCFQNFKAEGFGRVNLIGGKNNVGKTAFMEACYYASKIHIRDRMDAYMVIQFNRNPIAFVTNPWNIHNEFQFSTFTLNKEDVTNYYPFAILANDEKKAIYENSEFISLATNFNEKLLMYSLGEIKLLNQYDTFITYIRNIFKIDNIDIIKDKLMLQQNLKYYALNEYGDGLKHFIGILFSLFLNEDIIFLDEIENGIHYSNLDKLWEIILTVSKNQNVQVFATTHSKECIESYTRVAKKLRDEGITFIELGRNDANELMSIVYDFEAFKNEVEQNQEIRGW